MRYGAMGASDGSAKDLVNEMVDMVAFDAPDEAGSLARGASEQLRSEAAEYAQVLLYSMPDDPAVEKALPQVIQLLQSPPGYGQATPGAGMSTATKVGLGLAGLGAVWFLFLRKK